MASPHFTPTGKPSADVTGFSQEMRQEFILVEVGIEELKQLPITWNTNDAHAGGNHNEYFVFPFKCRIDNIYGVNSAANGASPMPVFIRKNADLMANPAFNFLASVPAETVLETDQDNFENEAVRLVDSGDFITINMQGDNVTDMPMSITFVVSPRV